MCAKLISELCVSTALRSDRDHTTHINSDSARPAALSPVISVRGANKPARNKPIVRRTVGFRSSTVSEVA